MSSTTRRQNSLKAFTIVESLVVLAILTVLTMVGLALYLHHEQPGQPAEITAPASSSVPNETPEEPSAE